MDNQISLDELLKVTDQDIETFKQCMTPEKCSRDEYRKYQKVVVFSIEVQKTLDDTFKTIKVTDRIDRIENADYSDEEDDELGTSDDDVKFYVYRDLLNGDCNHIGCYKILLSIDNVLNHMIALVISYHSILNIMLSLLEYGNVDIATLLLKYIKAKHPNIIKDDSFSCSVLKESLSRGHVDMFILLQEYILVLEGTEGLHTKLHYGFRC
tara:strand:+ start:818 stop:1447 length:630 start_codon:yes stop_codon:yes gene_type:complete